MPVAVACECSNRFTLKDEYAGRLVRCPACNNSVRAGSLTPDSQADPVFGRDVFLMRQKVAINEQYIVTCDQGDPLVFVERPAFFLRHLAAFAALFGTMFVGFILTDAVLAVIDLPDSVVSVIVFVVMAIATLAAAISVSLAIRPLRHVTFYRDENKTEKLLSVHQDSKLQVIWYTFTLRDDRGKILGSIRKNVFSNILRKTWRFHAVDGRPVLIAREDSIILSLLRRILGSIWSPLAALLRTNFVFHRHGTETVLGEFKRKLTILDRYVLDLTADGDRTLDRRVALAMGVMLDTGERR